MENSSWTPPWASRARGSGGIWFLSREDAVELYSDLTEQDFTDVGTKVSSWLHRIAVNQCITRQRRAKVRGETALEDEAEKNAAVFALPLDVSPARTAEKLERSVAVRRAVGALPPDLRQVIVMKEFEELTFQQISEALELPLSTVKSRLYTALRQLQMRLKKFGA